MTKDGIERCNKLNVSSKIRIKKPFKKPIYTGKKLNNIGRIRKERWRVLAQE